MYTVNSIRNICLLGHSGSGKSALAESLLYMTGAIVRMGKNADGNTVCDYDPEEVRRNISISTSVVPLDYKNTRINLLDAPGGFDFAGAAMEALRAADAPHKRHARAGHRGRKRCVPAGRGRLGHGGPRTAAF